jgi:predicted ThiF/HesA family dinucleotide-utilizing enzyme
MAKSLVRTEERLKTFAPVRYRGGGISGEGIIKDLSTSGSFIVGNTPVSVGMVLALNIFVPGDPAEVLLINRATVKWVKRSKFGVDFDPLTPKVAEQITQIIAKLMKTPAVSSGKK